MLLAAELLTALELETGCEELDINTEELIAAELTTTDDELALLLELAGLELEELATVMELELKVVTEELEGTMAEDEIAVDEELAIARLDSAADNVTGPELELLKVEEEP